MSSDDDDYAVLGLLLALVPTKKRRKKRECWSKSWLMKRDTYSHVNLLKELKATPKDWHNYLRMDENTYLVLLSLVAPLIERKNTVMRNAISPHERLTATLRFLATGRSLEDLKYSTVISPQALGKIIPETCEAIYQVLQKDHLKFPRTEEEWKSIAKQFEQRWNFPHCLGAVDGKHITITPPPDCGSEFFNYKGHHSMVLMAIVDGDYRFIMCDFGTNGRVSDGGVIQNTLFFDKLQHGTLNIPPEEIVKDTSTALPYVFVADDAFQLRVDMIKPFRMANLSDDNRKVYNYRVSRARRIVENAFGILSARFRIFHTFINMNPTKIESVVMASCVLHNFLVNTVPKTYAPTECFDIDDREAGITNVGYNCEHENMYGLQQRTRGNTITAARRVREKFIDYFVNEGSVPWQRNFIH